MSLKDEARKAIDQVKTKARDAAHARELAKKAYDKDRQDHARSARAAAEEAKAGVRPAKIKALKALREAKTNGWTHELERAKRVLEEAEELDAVALQAKEDALEAERIAGLSP